MKLLANITNLHKAFNHNRPPEDALFVLSLGKEYYAVSAGTAANIAARHPNNQDVEPMLRKRAKYIFRMPTPCSIGFLKRELNVPMQKTLAEHGYTLLR